MESFNICKKYYLFNAVIDAVTDGVYISSKASESNVTKTVIDFDIKRWKISLPIYKSLNYLYCEITRLKILSW